MQNHEPVLFGEVHVQGSEGGQMADNGFFGKNTNNLSD